MGCKEEVGSGAEEEGVSLDGGLGGKRVSGRGCDEEGRGKDLSK